jgi:ABC-2 type transport system permease protein
MKPFLYDLVRTLKSKALIALVVLIIVASLIVVPSVMSASVATVGDQPSFIWYDHDASGYHFLWYSANQFGQPIPANLSVIMTPQSSSASPYSLFLKTDSSGFGFGMINAPNASAGSSYSVQVMGPRGGSRFTLPLAPDGVSGILGDWYSIVSDAKNPSHGDIFVFCAGNELSPPVGYKVYYQVTSGGFGAVQNGTSMKLLGTLHDYATIFSTPPDFNLTGDTALWLYLSTPNDTTIAGSGPLGNGFFTGRAAAFDADSVASSVLTSVFGVLIPLVGILGAYNVYGRDRTSGVLESVLVRPISRRGLLFSRYVAVVVGLCLAAAAAMFVASMLVYWTAGVSLSLSFVVGMTGAMVVEIVAFVGITFLLSHLIRSSGTLIIISITLFLVLDVIWSIVVQSLLQLLGNPNDSVLGVQLQILSGMVNPTQFISLAEVFRRGIIKVGGSLAPGGLRIPVEWYGLTPWSMTVIGSLWMVCPLAASLYLARKGD